MSDEELLRGRGLAGDVEYRLETPEEVLALSPGMIAFLDANVKGMDDNSKFVDLVNALKGQNSMTLSYEYRTFTASETFAIRKGNCLSFTNMFLSMARHLGLDARFQEVDVPPDWTVRGGSYVLSRHINVFVNMAFQGDREVDFDQYNFRSRLGTRRISDSRAMAHFYNNKGAESMEEGQTGRAFQYLRRAITHGDSNFSPAWGNLGILYLRSDDLDHAENSFLRALQADSSDLVALSNLQHLYERQGKADLAAYYAELVERHRLRNPYYRYQLALDAYDRKDYDTSVKHLKKAIARKKNESAFYRLLSDNYLRLGDATKSARYLKTARQVAAESGSPERARLSPDELRAIIR